MHVQNFVRKGSNWIAKTLGFRGDLFRKTAQIGDFSAIGMRPNFLGNHCKIFFQRRFGGMTQGGQGALIMAHQNGG